MYLKHEKLKLLNNILEQKTQEKTKAFKSHQTFWQMSLQNRGLYIHARDALEGDLAMVRVRLSNNGKISIQES